MVLYNLRFSKKEKDNKVEDVKGSLLNSMMLATLVILPAIQLVIKNFLHLLQIKDSDIKNKTRILMVNGEITQFLFLFINMISFLKYTQESKFSLFLQTVQRFI